VRRLVFLVFFLTAVACAGGKPSVSERAHSIEAQVWSPYCPGRLLIDCTTTQSRELRAQINDRVAAGDSPADVIEWVRKQFGDEAIARPEGRGRGLVIWLVPPALFAIGALTVFGVMRRRKPATADPPADVVSDSRRRVRDEVRRNL
jgi:cytochrome c-type biogenesis protein CcmH